jgi:hypothetical protein
MPNKITAIIFSVFASAITVSTVQSNITKHNARVKACNEITDKYLHYMDETEALVSDLRYSKAEEAGRAADKAKYKAKRANLIAEGQKCIDGKIEPY